MDLLDGLVLIQPKVFADSRGYFLESYQEEKYKAEGVTPHFCQENHSFSVKGVVRGMHFQKGQAKLVYCPVGEIWDVVVDIRPKSKTYGKWQGFHLSEKNQNQLFLPDGFAHGFCVISEKAYVFYKISTYYDKEKERGFAWNDPSIGIKWPIENPILSIRDASSERLSSIV